MLLSSRWTRATTLAAMLALGSTVLPGCNSDRDAEAVAPAPRPDALQSAIVEIKNGNAASAQQRCEAYLTENPKSSYAPEAHYLAGQALAAQGEHAAAKKHLERAIDDTDDRTLKSLGMLGRADCNYALGEYNLASRQYHWLETMCRDVKALPQDEVMFKLGMACKKADAPGTADYWFRQVIEDYATGPYYERAKSEHSAYSPTDGSEPRVYSLEVDTFSTQEKAEAEANALKAKGYRDVEIIESSRTGFTVYEVHVGKFENKSDALRAYTDAELAGLPTRIRPAIIEPIK
jgi:TolA-binding protein